MNKLNACICDRCRATVGPPFSVLPGDERYFVSKMKSTKMHFCDEKCKTIFLKGRKYWRKKLSLQAKALIAV